MNGFEKIESCYKQIKNNFLYLSKYSFVWTSTFIATFQIIGFLCDFSNIFHESITFWGRLLISAATVAIIWLAVFTYKSKSILTTERVTIFNAENNHHVYAEYGDLFANNGSSKNVVITANRCFDTIVDNDLISETTIHGLAINKICTNGYTPEMLNDALQKNLSDRHIKPVCVLSTQDKRKGNLSRYPVGTIAEFKKSDTDNISYFFVGMSAFNSNLHPETTEKDYAVTVQSVIEYCNSRSQRFPVYTPIIGTNGLSSKKSERELLEYMVNALRFNKHLINTDIHIVVYSGRRNDVSIYGL